MQWWKDRIDGRTVFYFLVALLASAPAWIVAHPPLQDMPFHLATLRAIHSYGDPTFGFEENFKLALFDTQYILYYLAGTILAYVLGVAKANVALMCVYLAGTPLALRALLKELGKDERLCLFSLPLLVNTMFIYGFLPFVLGIPMMFYALAWGVRYVREPSRKNGIVLGVLAFLLFFAHVLPFALFGIGFAAMFPWKRPASWIKSGLPVVPALLAVVWWIKFSAAGENSANALGASKPAALDVAMQSFFQWTINVFRDTSEEYWAIGLFAVAAIAIGLSQGDKDDSAPESRPYVLLPIACLVAYFTLGDSLGEVWLFAQRFAAPGLLAAIPLLRIPSGMRGIAVVLAVLVVDVGSVANTCNHFIEFEQREVGDIDAALAQMDPAKKVAGLIYDSGSQVVGNAPFLHYVSYYQAEKGGVVQFSYSSFPHWPVQFKPGKFPPPGSKPIARWEWMPQRVTMQELFPYYDYVLTRGTGFRPDPSLFRPKYQGTHWSVWERIGG